MRGARSEGERRNDFWRGAIAERPAARSCWLAANLAVTISALALGLVPSWASGQASPSPKLEKEFLGSQQGFSHIAKITAGGVTTISYS